MRGYIERIKIQLEIPEMRVQTEAIFPKRPYFSKKILCPLNIFKYALE
jgi:hypothetical protein